MPHRSLRQPNLPGESGRWTKQAEWFETDEQLIAVVGPQEGKSAGSLLARGLHHREGRVLHLVLPREQAESTQRRRGWFDGVELSVYDLDGVGHADPKTLTSAPSATVRDAVAKSGNADASDPPLWSASRNENVRALVEWAAAHRVLVPAHRGDGRSWHAYGHAVLRIRSARGGALRVTAGIDYSKNPAVTTTVTAPLGKQALQEIIDVVDAAVEPARRSADQYQEHLMQAWLRRRAGVLGLEEPLLREVPAWRPSGPLGESQRGRGYIDLVGLDPVGTLVLVETKIGPDHMLGLQVLDYWTWASRSANRAFLLERLNASADAPMSVLLAVGGKPGKEPSLDVYTRATLQALPESVPWRIALVKSWPSAPDDESVPSTDDVELLPPRTLP